MYKKRTSKNKIAQNKYVFKQCIFYYKNRIDFSKKLKFKSNKTAVLKYTVFLCIFVICQTIFVDKCSIPYIEENLAQILNSLCKTNRYVFYI